MRRIHKRTTAILLVICMALGIFSQKGTAQAAVFDISTAVTFSVFASSHTIENSTMFIGTHLIHTQALTDELYEKALDSASESGQTNVYYKSELAGGVWFDITNATGLQEISTAGVMVEESELADLWVTHWTDSGGITRDALSDAAVSIFDVPDPYDLYNLPELEPIRIQYDNMFSSDSIGVDRYYYEKLTIFFQTDVRNGVTDECDSQLIGLQGCYETLKEQDETELAEIVYTLMGRIDARRRAEVFSQLAVIEDNSLTHLQSVASGSEYYIEPDEEEEDEDEEESSRKTIYDDEQFVMNADVMDAIGSGMQNCQESYTENSSKMLEEGTTVLKNVEYEDSMQVVGMSQGGWNTLMEPVLLELRDLYHIQDDIIANQEEELNLLDSKLISRISDQYVQYVSAGADGTYRAAVANGMSEAARLQLLEAQKTDADTVRSELQYLVQAKTNRMDTQEGMDFVYAQIDAANGYKQGIVPDDFEQKAGESVDAYILWLQQLARSIAGKDGGMGSDIENLEAQKEELQKERADALADNDLSTARLYDVMIAAVDEDIAAKQEELNAVLANPNSSASDKARAANEAGGSTLLNNISQMKNSALEAIADGNPDSDSLKNMVSGLAALGAEDALHEIKDALTGDNPDLSDLLDDAIEESKESSLYGLLDGAGASNEGDFSGLLESLFGGAFEELDGDEKAAVTAAANRIGEAGNQAIADLSRYFLNQCLKENNRYVYQRLNGQASEYIPLKVLAIAAGYRYIYSDSRLEASLSRRGTVYSFVVSGQEVALADGSTERLSVRVEMQSVPYVAEADALKYFSCEAEYLNGSTYGICLNEKMQGIAEELFAAFMEGVE